MGLPWQPKIRMRIIAGVDGSSRSVYAAIGVLGFAQLMLRYKAIRGRAFGKNLLNRRMKMLYPFFVYHG